MLQVDGICVTIKGFRILRGISLEIPAGGLIALVGRNGAGKTTTLKSIMGLLPITSGVIRLDNTDLVHVPGHRRGPVGTGPIPVEPRGSWAVAPVEKNLLPPPARPPGPPEQQIA